jgi:hypothetical protein
MAGIKPFFRVFGSEEFIRTGWIKNKVTRLYNKKSGE